MRDEASRTDGPTATVEHVATVDDDGETAVMNTPYGTTSVRRVSVLAEAQEADRAEAASTSAASQDTDPPEDADAAEDEDTDASAAPGASQVADDAETVAVPTQLTASTATTPAEAAQDTSLFAATAAAAAASTSTADEHAHVDEARGSRRRWGLWAAAACLLALVGVGAGGYAYAAHYAQAAVPGTTIAGQDVSGMTREQIAELVSDLEQDTSVTLSGDVEATASLSDLGVVVDADATAQAALAASDNVVDRFRALVGDNPVDVVVTVAPDTAESFTTGLIPDDQAVATDATVVLEQDGLTFVTTPASEGLSLDVDAAIAAEQEAARTLSSQSVTLTYSSRTPGVTDDEAARAAQQATELASQSVSITDSSDPNGRTWTPEATTQASWVVVAPTADGTDLTVAVDPAKVAQWVTESSEGAADAPVNGVRNVNSRGDVVATSVEAVNGNKITNAEDVSAALVEALNDGKPYAGDFTTEVVEATWTERLIADGAENLVYQAAPGEKWVDVNLSTKTVTAYEGATVVRGPISMVDGDPATPTVTGTYHVYLQYPSQTMEGDNIDGSRYRTEDVPWVSYFYSGYAFHGAPWRSSFGYSGSHGCVNMPVSEAQWIYNWVEIGTTVVSHY